MINFTNVNTLKQHINVPYYPSTIVRSKLKWNQEDVLELCRMIEAVAPQYGCHVALTGGALYKDGPRKDADIMLYRIRQVPQIQETELFAALVLNLGIVMGDRYGWVQKATLNGKDIDFFFPEYIDNTTTGEYNGTATAPTT